MIKFEYPHKSKMKFATKETIIKSGRAPSEEQHIVDEKNDLLRENRQKRAKIRELNKQLDSYDYTKERVSMILKSKAMPTADHRYDDLLENIERIPEELRPFVKNIEKNFESLLIHTNSKDIPPTNNEIKLYHLITLNERDKRKYKTIEGVLEETLLKTYRWKKGGYAISSKLKNPVHRQDCQIFLC